MATLATWSAALGRELDQTGVSRICVFREGGLGDAVQMVSLVPVFKTRWPNAEIYYCIPETWHPLFAEYPGIAGLLSMDGGLPKLLDRMRPYNFDLFLYGVDNSVLTGLVEAGVARYHLNAFSFAENTRWYTPIPVVLRNIARAISGSAETLGHHLQITPNLVAWADAQLRDYAHPLIGIHASSSCGWLRTKRWPVSQFTELAIKIQKQYGGTILILGDVTAGAVAMDHMVAVLESQQIPAVNYCGHTSLGKLQAIIRRLTALVSNDSGPLHLARALNTPALGIYLCTDARMFGTIGSGPFEAIQAPNECAGTLHMDCPYQGELHYACQRDLTVDMVYAAFERLMCQALA